MMRIAAIACLAAALAGCSTIPKEVRVPVPVPCKAEVPKRPTWATSTLKPGANIFDQVKALLAERRQRIGYETQLEAAVAACQ